MRELETLCGEEINSTIAKAIALASESGELVRFDFNGVKVVVAGDSSPDLIYRDWSRGMSGYLGENPDVGPHCKTELSPEELANDETVKQENARKAKERQAEYAKEQAEKTAKLQEALSMAGPIELTDTNAWEAFVGNNQDAYGSGVVRFAEKWARLMQVRIASGEKIEECADELMHLADDEGITGFMYGCAVQMLAKCWKHGEALRKWHNKDTQIGDEGDAANENGGVLNPAVLNVGRGI